MTVAEDTQGISDAANVGNLVWVRGYMMKNDPSFLELLDAGLGGLDYIILVSELDGNGNLVPRQRITPESGFARKDMPMGKDKLTDFCILGSSKEEVRDFLESFIYAYPHQDSLDLNKNYITN